MRQPSHLTPYKGRFAPSPSGPLHFGSLVAALGSYLDARSRGGEWLVRIEDLDPLREPAGAADSILTTLESFGFDWDGPVLRQSRRHDAYQAAAEELIRQGYAYPCGCSRREIAKHGRQGLEGPVYPGTCREGLPARRAPRSLRLRVVDGTLAFTDCLQGEIIQNPAHDIGDFVIRRADGPWSYQLAVVVDDAAQGITHVVRGADLLLSTPRQIYLQRLLSRPTPAYLHLPVAQNARGEKLSKQTHAAPLDTRHASASLIRALLFLGQQPPARLPGAELKTVWQWALENWDDGKLMSLGNESNTDAR